MPGYSRETACAICAYQTLRYSRSGILLRRGRPLIPGDLQIFEDTVACGLNHETAALPHKRSERENLINSSPLRHNKTECPDPGYRACRSQSPGVARPVLW